MAKINSETLLRGDYVLLQKCEGDTHALTVGRSATAVKGQHAGFVAVAGVHGPIHGLYLQVIAALSLISLPLNQDVSTFLFLYSIIFITNVHPSSLIVTVNLIQFHLLEVITCQ